MKKLVDFVLFFQHPQSMNFWKKLSCLSCSSAMAFSVFAAEEAKEVKAAPKETEKVTAEKKEVLPTPEEEALYCKVLGWMNTMQSGCKNIGMEARLQKSYVEGVQLALEGKEAPCKLGDIMEKMQKFLQNRAMETEKKRQAEIKVEAAENRKKAEEFTKKLLNENKKVQKTASGLLYEITKEGNGTKAKEEDTVTIYYTGELINGKVFDESKQKSVEFPLNGVIPGMKEGLQLVSEGGTATFYIPDHLAYGEYDIPGIPAGSLLVFKIEVLKVTKPVKETPKMEEKKEEKTEKGNSNKKSNKESDKKGKKESKSIKG